MFSILVISALIFILPSNFGCDFFSHFFSHHTSAFIVRAGGTLPATVRNRKQKDESAKVGSAWLVPLELTRRCQPRAGGRGLWSPWRARPARRWGDLCRCPTCTWWRWPHRWTRQWRTCRWHHSQVEEDGWVHWAGVVPARGLALPYKMERSEAQWDILTSQLRPGLPAAAQPLLLGLLKPLWR